MTRRFASRSSGLTLIELLVVLVISGILIAALYRTFIRQQKSYAVQDQVADMQQNSRVAIERMSREIRMAGYGGDILGVFGNVNGFSNIITVVENVNSVGTNDDRITILFADQVAVLNSNVAKTSTQLSVTNASQLFNTGAKKYLNLNGQNNYVVSGVGGSTITLSSALAEDHLADEPVYLVKAVTYGLALNNGKPALQRNENTGLGSQPLADNIENLQIICKDGSEGNPATPADIRRVEITVTAKTDMSDPEFKSQGGYRTRVLTSTVKVRNMGS